MPSMHSTYPKSPGFAVPDERPILAVPRSVVTLPGVVKWIPPLILVAAAAVLVESSGGGTLSRNLVVDAGLLAIVGASRLRRGRAPDLPLPRGWAWRVLPPAAVALIAAAPTIWMAWSSTTSS